MLDEVVVASLMELMCLVAIELSDTISSLHLAKAEDTLVFLVRTQMSVNGST